MHNLELLFKVFLFYYCVMKVLTKDVVDGVTLHRFVL